MTETPTAATETQEPHDAGSLVGTILSDRYRIEASLGEGGMGMVYLAEHTLMHKKLAIKVLHPEMTRLPEVVARFEREAMAAAHIEHPNVAAATDFGKLEDGSFFLVLEYVQGQSLRDALMMGPLGSQRAVRIGMQIASALARAHSLGIVHRDMKPENVMLVERDGDTDFVKVLDFGIAKVPVAEIIKDAPAKSRKALTQAGIVYGTPEYMAPEQALGQDVDARADLYALGTILYEMLAGVRPFEANSPVTLLGMQVTHVPPPFRERAPLVTVPEPLEALVMKLLEKEASKRPADAREVVEALEQLQLAARLGSAPQLIVLQGADRSQSTAAVTARTALELVGPKLKTFSNRAWTRMQPVAAAGAKAARSLWTRAVPLADRSMQAIQLRAPRVHAQLVRVQERLPERARQVPVLVWLSAAAAALIPIVLLGALLLCSPTVHKAYGMATGAAASGAAAPSGSAAARKPARATEQQIKDATAKGPAGIEQLMTQFPGDTDLLKVLGRAQMAANDQAAAVETYKKLLAVDTKAWDDMEVGQNVVLAAQAEASSEAAFGVLESDMGSRGIDLLYWLAYESKAAAKFQLRAARSLAKKEVRERGTPALQVAVEFRTASGCEGKLKLLDRAGQEGDRRMVPLLQPLFYDRGCGFIGMQDCWKCMRKGSLLATTLKQIEERAPDGGKN